MRKAIVFIGLILLMVIEILRVYFIMPFPGSQHDETLEIAYWIGGNIIWIRWVFVTISGLFFISSFATSKRGFKIAASLLIVIYAVIFYLFNFRFLAETMFYQPKNLQFSSSADNKIALEKQVLGIEINGEAKAYPIQLIGYHHQVRDSVGGKPVMVTYCTVCRTGRVFSPFVNGKPEEFRLVGMDHFNAMFEDAQTKSWWRQVSGEAVAGPLKGTKLIEVPSQQMTLLAWLERYPSSKIMQPDTAFKKQYDKLDGYDKGKLTGSLEKRDTGSWKEKSWVVGIKFGNAAIAIDWNRLVRDIVVQDSLPGLPFVIILGEDSSSFYAYSRELNGSFLQLKKKDDNKPVLMTDENTYSIWDQKGYCIQGPLQGARLKPVQSYQEYWHSWRTFNPLTRR